MFGECVKAFTDVGQPVSLGTDAGQASHEDAGLGEVIVGHCFGGGLGQSEGFVEINPIAARSAEVGEFSDALTGTTQATGLVFSRRLVDDAIEDHRLGFGEAIELGVQGAGGAELLDGQKEVSIFEGRPDRSQRRLGPFNLTMNRLRQGADLAGFQWRPCSGIGRGVDAAGGQMSSCVVDHCLLAIGDCCIMAPGVEGAISPLGDLAAVHSAFAGAVEIGEGVVKLPGEEAILAAEHEGLGKSFEEWGGLLFSLKLVGRNELAGVVEPALGEGVLGVFQMGW